MLTANVFSGARRVARASKDPAGVSVGRDWSAFPFSRWHSYQYISEAVAAAGFRIGEAHFKLYLRFHIFS